MKPKSPKDEEIAYLKKLLFESLAEAERWRKRFEDLEEERSLERRCRFQDALEAVLSNVREGRQP